MRKTSIFLIIFLLTLSCSLDRSNPLDIDNYPTKVLGITVSPPENNIITITWDTDGHANDDGYFIYCSMTYYGYYQLIKDIEDNEENLYLDEIANYSQDDDYWYKISAYRIINSKKLEGYRSDPKSW
ncbi:MAG: hypothetical protein HQ534_09760 [Armatimonadetes bacterium]|nr:hypothetical protein [Armatimonadota bacterium]